MHWLSWKPHCNIPLSCCTNSGLRAITNANNHFANSNQTIKLFQPRFGNIDVNGGYSRWLHQGLLPKFISILCKFAQNKAKSHSRLTCYKEENIEMQKLGWAEGRNSALAGTSLCVTLKLAPVAMTLSVSIQSVMHGGRINHPYPGLSPSSMVCGRHMESF